MMEALLPAALASEDSPHSGRRMDMIRTLLFLTPLGDDVFLLMAPSVATETLLQLSLVPQRVWQSLEDVRET